MNKENITDYKKLAVLAFKEMKKAKKGWSQELKTENDASLYIEGLFNAMAIAKLKPEQLKFGMKQLYLSESPWLPSAGEFIKWCKDGYKKHVAFINAGSTLKRLPSSASIDRELARNELDKIKKKLGIVKKH